MAFRLFPNLQQQLVKSLVVLPGQIAIIGGSFKAPPLDLGGDLLGQEQYFVLPDLEAVDSFAALLHKRGG